jgi:leucyl-tRNA synthetase
MSSTKTPYTPKVIEDKWAKVWDETKAFKAEGIDSSKPKVHVLDMFPYPSGEGLHIGHAKVFTASDVYARFKRMQGYNVLHATGWDAFGLPAEQYALKNKVHPKDTTKKNTDTFRRQMKLLGLSYDWDREINTTDPNFYKWTQWIFLQLWNKGLVKEVYEPINWCPSCKTGLANEDLEGNACERCGTIVEKKPLRQFSIEITKYAEKLLDGLNDLDWKESVKDLERNWIGKSEGAEIEFQLKKSETPSRPEYIDNVQPPKDGLETTNRKGVMIIIKHWNEDKYLLNISEKYNWKILFTGGIEEGESVYEAARREVLEETGFKDIESVQKVNFAHTDNFERVHKGDNARVEQTNVFVKLASDSQVDRSAEESVAHQLEWHTREEMSELINRRNHKFVFDFATTGDYSDFENVFSGYKTENYFGINKTFTVFTTRPDTLFGCTYCVLAPENVLVSEMLAGGQIENKEEVEKYIEEVKLKTEIERSAEGREKTGVELKGVKAVNPANNEEVPIFIADYVLASYGTGAIMAVPAHDERDFEFAKKYNLPIIEVVYPVYGKANENSEWRSTVSAFVRRQDGKFLALKWKQFDWLSVPVGGIEDGESAQSAAEREVLEETGYKTTFVRLLGGKVESHFFADNKKVWRSRLDQPVLLELCVQEQETVSDEEKDRYDSLWFDATELIKKITHEYNAVGLVRYVIGNDLYTGSGKLYNSNEFNGMDSEEAKKAITEFVGGKMVTKYKLRDWVFARQRYWGEPFPLVHVMEKNEIGEEVKKIYPVDESDLPVVLPDVKDYEPTGTGESPLANIEEWVNVEGYITDEGTFKLLPNEESTPDGKQVIKARRETNTMPQWAGSSWYWLRYMDPKNSERFVGRGEEKYWGQVDIYLGGMEHATRHLIYGRFWHRFLYDIGELTTPEPFKRLEAVGLVLGEGGVKMSKRLGNVINPDDVADQWGVDTLRTYILFMGPYHDSVAWNSKNLIGPRRFLERVWAMQYELCEGELSKETNILLNQTIKKLTEDNEALRFNTGVSAIMILFNALEKETVSRETYLTFLKLLAPYAPFMTEEIWQSLRQEGSIHHALWPTFDSAQLESASVTVAVQYNGRVRDTVEVSNNATQAEVEQAVRESASFAKWVGEQEIKKVIFVPNKIINLIV